MTRCKSSPRCAPKLSARRSSHRHDSRSTRRISPQRSISSRASPQKSPQASTGRWLRRVHSRRCSRTLSRSRSRKNHSLSSSSGEQSDSGEVRSRIWVAHADCAKIIGRRGEARESIEQRSEACLRIMREEDMDMSRKERYIELLGTSRQRRKALKLVMRVASFVRDDTGQVLKDLSHGSSAEGQVETMQVRSDEVGRFLGRGGENIRRIEEESSARLELDRSDGRLEIRGAAAAVARAREMVLAEVNHVRGNDSSNNRDENRLSSNVRNFPRSTIPLRLWVHSKEAGRVIGRGGETIREIMQRTGADIQVQRSDGTEHGNAERLIQIFGTKCQQNDAYVMLINGVSYCRGENGVIKSFDMSARETEEASGRGGSCVAPMSLASGLAAPPAGSGWVNPMGMMSASMMGIVPGMLSDVSNISGMSAISPGAQLGLLNNGFTSNNGLPPTLPLPLCPPSLMGGAASLPNASAELQACSSSSSSSSSCSSAGKEKRRSKIVPPFFPTPWKPKSIDWDEL